MGIDFLTDEKGVERREFIMKNLNELNGSIKELYDFLGMNPDKYDEISNIMKGTNVNLNNIYNHIDDLK